MPDGAPLSILVLNKRQSLEIPFSQQITIGRDVVNTLPLIDDEASRSHAILYAVESGDGETELTVKNLNSLNGVFLNGKNVEESSLKAGDELVIGATILLISPGPNMDLEDCLSKKGRAILKSIRSPKPFRPSPLTSFTVAELREIADDAFANQANSAIWLPKNASALIKGVVAMSEADNLADFHNTTLQAAKLLVAADRGVIMTQESDGKTLGIRGLFSEMADQTLTINQGVMRMIIAGDKAIFSPDTVADDRMPDLKDPPHSHDPHTLLAVPFECAGKPWGFLYLDSLNRSYSFDQWSLVLISLLLRPFVQIGKLKGFLP